MVLKVLNFQHLVAIGDFGAQASRRGECNHFICREGALGEDGKHFTTHITRGADDCDLETHYRDPLFNGSLAPLMNPFNGLFVSSPPGGETGARTMSERLAAFWGG